MSVLSLLLCFNITGWRTLILVMTILSIAVTLCVLIAKPEDKYELKLVILFSFGLFFAVTLCKHYTVAFGLPKNRITALEGRMLYDSAFSNSGKGLVRISVSRCRDNCGNWASARGIVTAVGNEKAVVTSGIGVRLEGEFSDELFIYETLQVTRRSWVNGLREFLIEKIEGRLFGSEPDAPALLSSLLLLGRSEDYNFPLKQAALDCGCAHVLALSGMHLSVLASICALFGRRKGARALSFVVIATFIFVAGPRPSLVRSAIMFFLGKQFSAKQRVVMAFFIQCIFLPYSMLDLGCCYGYVSVFAIIFLWEVVKAPLVTLAQLGLNKLLSPILLSVTVLLLCAPVQLIQEGQWCPVAIIVSPFAGFLVTISMVSGLLTLSFGRLKFLIWINRLAYTALAKLFENFSTFPKGGWLGYAVMVFLVVALQVFCLIYRKIRKSKVKVYRFIGEFDLNWEELEI